MQFHTTPILPAVEADKLSDCCSHPPGTALTLIAIALAASVFGNWLASLIVARPNATIGRAFLTLVSEFLYAIGVVIAGIRARHISSAPPKAAGDVVMIAGLLALALFIVSFRDDPDADLRTSEPCDRSASLSSVQLIGWGDPRRRTIGSHRPHRLSKARAPTRKVRGDKFKRANGQRHRNRRLSSARRRCDSVTNSSRSDAKYLPPNDRKAFADYERDRAIY
jgi:hypothetical protein